MDPTLLASVAGAVFVLLLLLLTVRSVLLGRRRFRALEQDHQWLKTVKQQEIAAGIHALQERMQLLEGRLPSLPSALTTGDLKLDQRVAAVEKELRWHQQTKHGELEQGFARLEQAISELQGKAR